MDASEHAVRAAGSGGGPVRAPRAFLAQPRHRMAVWALVFAGCWTAAAVKIAGVTGADGLVVGVPLAAAPVPLVVGTFLLLTKARPQPWPHLAFALAWGAGAGAMAALYANSWSIDAIVERADERQAELLGLTVVAPFVEEAAKGAAVLLLLAFRRHWFRGPLDGLVLAATTAAGFAFTENVLYFGRAFGEADGGAASQTAAIFVGRAVLTPFAHPLFTSAIGLALGCGVLMRRRAYAVGTALGGYLVAVGLHAGWNAAAWKSAAEDDPLIMLGVYFAVMLPLLAGLFVLGARLRRTQLDAVARQLPYYVRAGWLTWNEAVMLGSVTDRGRQRDAADARFGKRGLRLMRQYQWNATALAELRDRTERGHVTPDAFTPRERVLLHRLWSARMPLHDVLTYIVPTPRWAAAPGGRPPHAGMVWAPPGAWPAGTPYPPAPGHAAPNAYRAPPAVHGGPAAHAWERPQAAERTTQQPSASPP
ncbi:PrsW family intramembrane metalloprotease [Yinghuangia sp. ASG 101]|uniref:PrsW family intramembrane metalloprotease n=1 Tax=Yinghuangia sp. ASG 101 TaxID=2896848 RepID=UPI0022B238C7|nr:PrsW family glutamic-type intramembrane protease [Yinghuangia sp. ASG 101]